MKLQWLKLYSKLYVENVEDGTVNDCFLNNLEDKEQNLKQIVSCFTEDSTIGKREME